jgi:hypothetical protein
MIRSFLLECTTTLIVDNEETPPRQLVAGVPQGSPLSPILFIFYNSGLLESLDLPDLHLSTLGFADDVNLLTYGKSTLENCTTLELAHDKCLAWARMHGMQFSIDKYTLAHFVRRGDFDKNTPVRIGTITIDPSPAVKILGLQLDSELKWNT